jgi:hypothetical protein
MSSWDDYRRWLSSPPPDFSRQGIAPHFTGAENPLPDLRNSDLTYGGGDPFYSDAVRRDYAPLDYERNQWNQQDINRFTQDPSYTPGRLYTPSTIPDFWGGGGGGGGGMGFMGMPGPDLNYAPVYSPSPAPTSTPYPNNFPPNPWYTQPAGMDWNAPNPPSNPYSPIYDQLFGPTGYDYDFSGGPDPFGQTATTPYSPMDPGAGAYDPGSFYANTGDLSLTPDYGGGNWPFYVDQFPGGDTGGGGDYPSPPGVVPDVARAQPADDYQGIRTSDLVHALAQDKADQGLGRQLGAPTDWSNAGRLVKDAYGNLVNAAGQIVQKAGEIAGRFGENIMNDPRNTTPDYLAGMGYHEMNTGESLPGGVSGPLPGPGSVGAYGAINSGSYFHGGASAGMQHGASSVAGAFGRYGLGGGGPTNVSSFMDMLLRRKLTPQEYARLAYIQTNKGYGTWNNQPVVNPTYQQYSAAFHMPGTAGSSTGPGGAAFGFSDKNKPPPPLSRGTPGRLPT